MTRAGIRNICYLSHVLDVQKKTSGAFEEVPVQTSNPSHGMTSSAEDEDLMIHEGLEDKATDDGSAVECIH